MIRGARTDSRSIQLAEIDSNLSTVNLSVPCFDSTAGQNSTTTSQPAVDRPSSPFKHLLLVALNVNPQNTNLGRRNARSGEDVVNGSTRDHISYQPSPSSAVSRLSPQFTSLHQNDTSPSTSPAAYSTTWTRLSNSLTARLARGWVTGGVAFDHDAESKQPEFSA